jgi:DNA-binding MarR family transcriptional regulator
LFPGNNITHESSVVKIVSRKPFERFDILIGSEIEGDEAMAPALNKQREPVIIEIMSLMSQAAQKLEPDSLGMKQWIIENYNDPKVANLLQDSTFMMLRVLNAIGQLQPVNGISISKQFRIPKGSVSKATRRLIAKKLIKTESLPNNKKEILYRTTPLGQDLFEAHRAFDQQMEKSFVEFLKKYNEAELRFIVRLLRDITEVTFLTTQSQEKQSR